MRLILTCFPPAIAGLAAIANGGAPCGNPFDGPTILHKDTVKSVFSAFKKRVDYIKGDTVKYVALHYSQQTPGLSSIGDSQEHWTDLFPRDWAERRLRCLRDIESVTSIV